MITLHENAMSNGAKSTIFADNILPFVIHMGSPVYVVDVLIAWDFE